MNGKNIVVSGQWSVVSGQKIVWLANNVFNVVIGIRITDY